MRWLIETIAEWRRKVQFGREWQEFLVEEEKRQARQRAMGAWNHAGGMGLSSLFSMFGGSHQQATTTQIAAIQAQIESQKAFIEAMLKRLRNPTSS